MEVAISPPNTVGTSRCDDKYKCNQAIDLNLPTMARYQLDSAQLLKAREKMASRPTVPATPAERLLGHRTHDGWHIAELLRSSSLPAVGLTGANFSVGYRVTRTNQRSGQEEQAFLKALDVDRGVHGVTNLIGALREKLNEFHYEQSMHELCKNQHMSRVVRVIEAGQLDVPPEPSDRIPQVPYLVLEIADAGDVRSWVGKLTSAETVLKLAYLKHVVTGLQQLHKASIAHQDLKPSNVMIFQSEGAKIGDLGRVVTSAGNGPFDSLEYPGDYNYAPPEVLYRHSPVEWVDKRERCDLYQFGNLCVYLFSGVELNTWIKKHLDPVIQPIRWGGSPTTYQNALPYWIDAFEKVLIDLGNTIFPEWASDSMVKLVRECAHPDYSRRGATEVFKWSTTTTGLDRMISHLGRLVSIAEVKLRLNDNATKAAKVKVS